MTATAAGAAHCISRCGWTAAGTPEDADKAAAGHTRKTGHPTATVAVPRRPPRAAEGARKAAP